jgi:NAD-dependent DNA ligase
MNNPATNRQRKLLRFFSIPFGPNISFGAAGWEIDSLMSNERNREEWRRYVYLTKDYGNDSDQLQPFDKNALHDVSVPKDWSSAQAVQDYREDLAASILSQQSPFDSPEPVIVFRGHAFVFTGEFDFGTRKECQDAVVRKGGAAPNVKFVSQNIDYLVIGQHGSPVWKRGSYGNKIESAILARRDHGKPAIISEKHWTKCLDKEIK